MESLNPGGRRLAGTILLVLFVLVYVLAAMVAASMVLPEAAPLAQFVYYAVAGLAWVPAAGLIISWTYKNDPRRRAN